MNQCSGQSQNGAKESLIFSNAVTDAYFIKVNLLKVCSSISQIISRSLMANKLTYGRMFIL